MKILILEDTPEKLHSVKNEIFQIDPSFTVESVGDFRNYHSRIMREKFDLLIVDLVVLDFPVNGTTRDMTEQITEVTRDFECPNYRTPVLALTQYDEKAEEKFKNLNEKDITVITFDEGNCNWKTSLKHKIELCIPPLTFDFVIVCALEKEAEGFSNAGYEVGATLVYQGLFIKEMSIADRKGAIVTAPRMGLVSAAITCTQAIDLFKPKLICMSGICAGVKDRAKIYDVVLPDICHQNDSGKWTESGFVHEGYSVQLEHGLRQILAEVICRGDFLEAVGNNVKIRKSEIPDGLEELTFDVFLAPTSSGSAVVADETVVRTIGGQHRKLSAFEMESFSLYEAARLSPIKPKYFSAKSVVDDGSASKGDSYHRIAAILSAKVVYECIRLALVKEF